MCNDKIYSKCDSVYYNNLHSGCVCVDIAWKGRTFVEVIVPTVMAMGVAYALSHFIRLSISLI